MNSDTLFLIYTSASIAFFHTLMGPDHYLPFAALAKAKEWSHLRTLCVTGLCGLGHVISSVAIGGFGIVFGIGISEIEIITGFQGNIAATFLIIFGFLYLIYGIWSALKKKKHTHSHLHFDGITHSHNHDHINYAHTHIHEESEDSKISVWVIFLIFVFGPCEPLIPILMYPAYKGDFLWTTVWVAVVFGIVTLVTMTVIVFFLLSGLNVVHFKKIEKYNQAMAGATILFCGAAIHFFGL